MTNTAEITTMLATMASKIAKSDIREFDVDERFLRFALMGAIAKMLLKEELQEEFERRSYKQLVMPWRDIDEESDVEITQLDDGVKVIEIKLCAEKENEGLTDEGKSMIWHPFPEETPVKDGRYLVTIPNEDDDEDEQIIIAYWDKRRWLHPSNNLPIAWAELPEPYDPSGENE